MKIWSLALALGVALPIPGLASGLPDFIFTDFHILPETVAVAPVNAVAVSSEEDWRQDARDMCKIWRARNPRTADLTLYEWARRAGKLPRGASKDAFNDPVTNNLPLCAYAARELRKVEGSAQIPRLWRVALAYWINGSSLKPTMSLTVKGMKTRGLTDANVEYCMGHRDAVKDILQVLGRGRATEADMFNPFCSIRWWLVEYREWKSRLRSEDHWRIAGVVFWPASAYASPKSWSVRRVQREIRVWKSIDAQNGSIMAQAASVEPSVVKTGVASSAPSRL